MINLYSASLGMLEKIIEKVPNISKGVLVEKVSSLLPKLDLDLLGCCLH